MHRRSVTATLVVRLVFSKVSRYDQDETKMARRILRLNTPFQLRDAGRVRRLTYLPDAELEVDGGALFGPTDRREWAAELVPDADGRVRLTTGGLLVESRERLLLVDCGIGDKPELLEETPCRVRRPGRLLEGLAAAGYAAEDVDYVVLTHLHAAHAGGAVHLDGEGRLRPSFPRARYLVQRAEWTAAAHPNAFNRPLYRGADYRPLRESGNLVLLDGEVEVMRGVRCLPTGGHSPGHQVVIFEGRERVACHLGDLCATRAHVVRGRRGAWEENPPRMLRAKERFLAYGWRMCWTLTAALDPDYPFFSLEGGDGSRRAVPVEALSVEI